MIGFFLINIFLVFVWVVVIGSFVEVNLVFGFVLGIVVLYLICE